MGLFDKLKRSATQVKGKAEEYVRDNEHKVDGAIDKAADTIDRRTGGKHADKIDKGRAKARQAVDKLAADGDDPAPPRPR